MARSARAQTWLLHTILCALARGDLEFWSVAEKLQMTAAWDSQNGCVSRKGGCAMAVTMASAKKCDGKKF
jgi:hypothetical protein